MISNLFENSNDRDLLKDFFKDKIDWKLYNYLQYNTLNLEDEGKDVCINVVLFRYDDPGNIRYTIYNGRDGRYGADDVIYL